MVDSFGFPRSRISIEELVALFGERLTRRLILHCAGRRVPTRGQYLRTVRRMMVVDDWLNRGYTRRNLAAKYEFVPAVREATDHSVPQPPTSTGSPPCRLMRYERRSLPGGGPPPSRSRLALASCAGCSRPGSIGCRGVVTFCLACRSRCLCPSMISLSFCHRQSIACSTTSVLEDHCETCSAFQVSIASAA